jgi:hypothetical protein
MLLALLEAAARKGMIWIDAQHGAPRSSGFLVMPEGVVDGRQMEASIEVIATATNGGFEVGGRFLETLPTQVQQTSLVPRMCMVWSSSEGLVERCFSPLGSVEGDVASGQLRQGMVVVWHGLDDDFQIVHCIVPMRQGHLGFGASQACEQQIWGLNQQPLRVLKCTLWEVASKVRRTTVEASTHMVRIQHEGFVVLCDGVLKTASARGDVPTNVGDKGAFSTDVGRVGQAFCLDIVPVLQRQKGGFCTQGREMFIQQTSGPSQ